MRFVQGVIRVVGFQLGLLLLLSPIFLSGFTLSWAETLPVTGFLVVWGMVSAASALWIRDSLQEEAKGDGFSERRELELLRSASECGGRLTAEELVVERGWSLEEARQALVGLVDKGVAEPWVNDYGLVVYVLPAFLSGSKAGARSPFSFPEFDSDESESEDAGESAMNGIARGA